MDPSTMTRPNFSPYPPPQVYNYTAQGGRDPGAQMIHRTSVSSLSEDGSTNGADDAKSESRIFSSG